MPITSYREYGVYTVCKKRCAALGIEFGFTSGEQFFAEVGRRPSTQHKIARINPDGPFGPGNVCWITGAEKKARTKAQQRERQERKHARTAAKHAFFAEHRAEQSIYYAIRHRCKAEGFECRFESFEQFCAEIGPRPSPNHILKRIDTGGHYEPGNVRWMRKQDTPEEKREKERIKCSEYRERHRAEIGPRRRAQYAAKHRAHQLAREQERQQREQARACKREHSRQQREREDRARKAYKVYCLIDPITGKVRYVGHTHTTLSQRLKRHLDDWRDGKRDTCERKREWIAGLKKQGFRPFILMLHSVATKGEAVTFERQEIGQFIAEGCDLLNGNLPLTPELAQTIFDLRISGKLFREIAKQTGVNFGTCYLAFRKMIGDLPDYLRRNGNAPYTETKWMLQ